MGGQITRNAFYGKEHSRCIAAVCGLLSFMRRPVLQLQPTRCSQLRHYGDKSGGLETLGGPL